MCGVGVDVGVQAGTTWATIARIAADDATLAAADLAESGIDDATAAGALADALKRNTHLTALKLGGNAFGEDAARAVGEAIGGNEALRGVVVDVGVQAVTTWATIARIAADDATLAATDLSNAGIDDAAATGALADALKRNTHLKELKLGGNAFGDDAARAVRDALCANAALLANGIAVEGEDARIGDVVNVLARIATNDEAIAAADLHG